MADMAQLNIRMDTGLKAAGDSALSLYDIAPSEIVRSLWRYVAHGHDAIRDIALLFRRYAEEDAAKSRPAYEEAETPSEWVQLRWEAFAQEVGLDLATFTPMTDEEHEEAAYQEWLEKERERSIYYAD